MNVKETLKQTEMNLRQEEARAADLQAKLWGAEEQSKKFKEQVITTFVVHCFVMVTTSN